MLKCLIVKTTHSGLKRFFHGTAPAAHLAYRPFYNKHKKVTDPARQDLAYFEKEADKLELNDYYIDALKSLWEEKIGSERELMYKAQDFLIGNTTDFGLPSLDMSQPRLEYRGLKVLAEAPESVQRIFSLDHGERSDFTTACKKEMTDRVRYNQLDQHSLPAKIAWATATIRHWTALYEDLMQRRAPQRPWYKMRKRPKWLSAKLHNLIYGRRKMLRLLREQSEEEFEKVIHTLNIAYHVEKPQDKIMTRKLWSEAQLRRRVDEAKQKQLDDLHAKFKEGREERVAQMDAELASLEEEERRISDELKALDVFEGKTVDGHVEGKYAPNLIGELKEVEENLSLFYREPRKAEAVM
ncbi:hypothetical protein niasHS_007671 [Heterodera schachtii]|uniref:Small ribosomal subunit protein uS15m n=1 Tax=Heterodera schachtii TaxID=97005 RepID=A0ABD2JPB6_HETSC